MRQRSLRELRQRAGFTQAELAEKANVDQPTISRLESGTVSNPGIDTVLKLAAALKIDPRDLRFGPSNEAVA